VIANRHSGRVTHLEGWLVLRVVVPTPTEPSRPGLRRVPGAPAARHDQRVTARVRVEPALLEDKELIRQLLEFNGYEFSRLTDADLDAHGRFGYRYLDHYWTEPDRRPFLITVDAHLAGMALVGVGPPHTIAEFLIMPKYRRRGVGTAAARQLFARFPGAWDVHELARNTAAVDFWRKAIPGPFSETQDEHGTTQHFVISTLHPDPSTG
jgi:predicted acetyltransferase